MKTSRSTCGWLTLCGAAFLWACVGGTPWRHSGAAESHPLARSAAPRAAAVHARTAVVVDTPEQTLNAMSPAQLAGDEAQDAFRRWCAASCDRALSWALELRLAWPAKRRFLQLAAAAWAIRDLPAALAALAQLPESESKDELRLALGYEAARTAPREALQLALEFPANRHRDELLVCAIAEWAGRDPGRAAEWADALPAGESRDRIMGALCTAWANRDALAAADWALRSISPGEQQDRALTAIVQRWAQREPDAAAAIVTKLPPGDLQAAVVDAFIPLWAQASDSAVAAWLARLPPGPLRDRGHLAYTHFHVPESK